MTSESALASGWARISREMLSGEALEPYAQGVVSPGFLDTVTPHLPGQKMLAVLSGDIWVALFEHTGGETHAPFFPGDEYVYALAGTVTLTDDNSDEALTFGPGEEFFVPKGWQGTWASEGFYREIAVCSRDWLSTYQKTFHPGIVDAQRRDAVLTIDTARARQALEPASEDDGASGLRRAHIQGSDLLIELVACEEQSGLTSFEDQADQFVHVLAGGVTLGGDDGARETFELGECFVVSGAFRGIWEFRSDYLALVVKAGVSYDQ